MISEWRLRQLWWLTLRPFLISLANWRSRRYCWRRWTWRFGIRRGEWWIGARRNFPMDALEFGLLWFGFIVGRR